LAQSTEASYSSEHSSTGSDSAAASASGPGERCAPALALDTFETSAFNNSHGSMPWLSPWYELDTEGEGPALGNVQIQQGTLVLQVAHPSAVPEMTRFVDLHYLLHATLRFHWRAVSLESQLKDGSQARLLVTARAAGQPWVTLLTLPFRHQNPDPMWSTSLVDLSAYDGRPTAVRFRFEADTPNDWLLLLDNVLVVAQTCAAAAAEGSLPSLPEGLATLPPPPPPPLPPAPQPDDSHGAPADSDTVLTSRSSSAPSSALAFVVAAGAALLLLLVVAVVLALRRQQHLAKAVQEAANALEFDDSILVSAPIAGLVYRQRDRPGPEPESVCGDSDPDPTCAALTPVTSASKQHFPLSSPFFFFVLNGAVAAAAAGHWAHADAVCHWRVAGLMPSILRLGRQSMVFSVPLAASLPLELMAPSTSRGHYELAVDAPLAQELYYSTDAGSSIGDCDAMSLVWDS
jgi:hypothetical protein